MEQSKQALRKRHAEELYALNEEHKRQRQCLESSSGWQLAAYGSSEGNDMGVVLMGPQ